MLPSEYVEKVFRQRLEEAGGDSHASVDAHGSRFCGRFSDGADFGHRHVVAAQKNRFPVLHANEIAREVGLGFGDVDPDYVRNLDQLVYKLQHGEGATPVGIRISLFRLDLNAEIGKGYGYASH